MRVWSKKDLKNKVQKAKLWNCFAETRFLPQIKNFKLAGFGFGVGAVFCALLQKLC